MQTRSIHVGTPSEAHSGSVFRFSHSDKPSAAAGHMVVVGTEASRCWLQSAWWICTSAVVPASSPCASRCANVTDALITHVPLPWHLIVRCCTVAGCSHKCNSS